MKCKNCNKNAVFGEIDGEVEFCGDHKLVIHVDLVSKTCIHVYDDTEERCTTRPTYGKKGSKEAEYCKEHKPNDYVNVVNKTCIGIIEETKEQCPTRPTYGMKGSKEAEYCRKHKPNDYVDVVSKTCIGIIEETKEQCPTIPIYGMKGSKKAEYCKKHKPDDYVNVKDKTCIHPNCSTRPNYGKKGSKKAEYCRKHKPNDYVDIKNKTCIYINEETKEQCPTIPNYGKKGAKKAEYCFTHKPNDYVDVKHETCIHIDKETKEQCTTRPNYGMKGSKKAEYCFTHKPPDYVNVKDKTCIHIDKETKENCPTKPSYGYPGYSPEYCSKHRFPRMVIHPKKKPKEEDKQCTYCCHTIHYNEEYCSGCKLYVELENTTVKQKEKELTIKSLLDKAEIKYIHDKRVVDGCSKRRPDFQINVPFGTIIIEVDEFQHRRITYSSECEITRMKQIYYDHGLPYMLFIRYNPDSYKGSSRGKNKITDSKRQEYLIKFLQEQFENKIECGLFAVYLFYDYFDMTKPEIEIVD